MRQSEVHPGSSWDERDYCMLQTPMHRQGATSNNASRQAGKEIGICGIRSIFLKAKLQQFIPLLKISDDISWPAVTLSPGPGSWAWLLGLYLVPAYPSWFLGFPSRIIVQASQVTFTPPLQPFYTFFFPIPQHILFFCFHPSVWAVASMWIDSSTCSPSQSSILDVNPTQKDLCWESLFPHSNCLYWLYTHVPKSILNMTNFFSRAKDKSNSWGKQEKSFRRCDELNARHWIWGKIWAKGR